MSIPLSPPSYNKVGPTLYEHTIITAGQSSYNKVGPTFYEHTIITADV